jgi:hypothetical protein
VTVHWATVLADRDAHDHASESRWSCNGNAGRRALEDSEDTVTW